MQAFRLAIDRAAQAGKQLEKQTANSHIRRDTRRTGRDGVATARAPLDPIRRRDKARSIAGYASSNCDVRVVEDGLKTYGQCPSQMRKLARQQLSGATELRGQRSGRAVHLLGDFCIAQAFDVAQNDDQSEPWFEAE